MNNGSRMLTLLKILKYILLVIALIVICIYAVVKYKNDTPAQGDRQQMHENS